MDVRDDKAWLLRSRFSPFPVPGSLELIDGTITFTLDESAAESSLDWIEDHVGDTDLETKLRGGASVVVFAYPLAECDVTWPITGGGMMMVVASPERRWVVSYDHPVGGSVLRSMALVASQRRAREWKKALADAEG